MRIISVAAMVFALTVLGFAQGGKAVVYEKTEKYEVTVEPVISGLDHPWAAAFLPDGRILITERPGSLKVWDKGNVSEVKGLPGISSGGQGGLLDIIADRNFSVNKTVYFTFSKSGNGGRGTAVARAKLEGITLSEVSVIWEMERKTYGGIHFGSRIRQLADRTLVFTVGERGTGERAQDLADDAGKVHRINTDGTIPGDNPFSGRPDVRQTIYSYGHRNPQGLAVQPDTGALWLTEHGPQGGDEVNLVEPGKNYGWPVITYGRQYGSGAPIGEGTKKQGMEQPLVYWVPSIAPSGLEFYTGKSFPLWDGSLFSGNLAGKLLMRMEVEGDRIVHQERMLAGRIGRIRDVRQGPDGFIYLLTDEDNGGVYRLKPID